MQRPATNRPAERRHPDDPGPATAARWTARVLGVVFILIALIGFFSAERMLGAFSAHVMHNWIHLLSGVVLLGFGFASEVAARITLWVFAAIYGLIMLLGFLGVAWLVDTMNLTAADHWLHLVLLLVFVIGAGVSHAQERTHHETATATPRGRT